MAEEGGGGSGAGGGEYVVGDFTREEIEDLRNEGFLEDDKHLSGDSGDDDTEDYSACVVLDGLPIVPETKYAALCSFVKKLVQQISKTTKKPLWPLASDTAMYMPMEGGNTLGYCFVEYASQKYADFAIVNLDNKPFDKKHTIRVNRYDDIYDYRDLESRYVDEEADEFEEGIDPKSWLLDGQCRDQFLIRHGRETEIYWTHPRGVPELCYAGEEQKKRGPSWTDKDAIWSPQGNFVATFHSRGILLWGGSKFGEFKRLEHSGVSQAFFTKDERFSATWSGYEGNDRPEGALVVWDLRTVGNKPRKVREFKQLSQMREACDSMWSPDGKFLVRCSLPGPRDRDARELLYVYEAEKPDMPLQEMRSIVISRARGVSFPPAGKNVLAWWCPEVGNAAACVRLMELPSRKIVREKNLFEVKDCQMHWHPEGTFLCVQVTRHTKTKKREYTHFQLFRLTEKDIPIQLIEIRDEIRSFSWEGNGTRFAIVHGDGARFKIGIYDMGKPGTAKPSLSFEVDEKPHSTVHWSPTGRYAVFASLQLTACQLEFWDIDNQHRMNQEEHFRCNSVVWEQAGRMVCTQVTTDIGGGGGVSDNGYALWTFQGVAVHSSNHPKYHNFKWRPRPASLLNNTQKKQVARNLKKYIQRYQADDRRVAKKRELAMLEDRAAEYKEFMTWYRRLRREEYLDTTADREDLRDGATSDYEDADDVVEELEMEVSTVEKEVRSFEE